MRPLIPASLFAALGLGVALLLEGQASSPTLVGHGSVPATPPAATSMADSVTQDLRKGRHVVRQDALHVRREEERIASLERRARRLRLNLERDEKAGRTSRLEEDRESLKQAQGALAAERGRLALAPKN